MKKHLVNILCSLLTLSLCGATVARPKEYRNYVRPGSSSESKMMAPGGEPTCEELRAMWRFSRRQSRAAEITNEIPTYKDPFAYNVWEQYSQVRSPLGRRPIFGKVLNSPRASSNHLRALNPAYEEVLRYMDYDKPEEENRLRFHTSRLSGGLPTVGQTPPNRLSKSGSFQHLKELIWAERTKELHQQRLLEEAAAKSAAEKMVKEYDDHEKERNNKYRYNMDQEAKAARLRLLNGESGLNMGYAPDMLRKAYRMRSAFNTEPSNDRLW